MVSKVVLQSAHGSVEIEADYNYTVSELCKKYRIPSQSITMEIISQNVEVRKYVGLFNVLNQIEGDELRLVLDRNIKLESVTNLPVVVCDSSQDPVAEYTFRSQDIPNTLVHKYFNQDECQQYVQNEISKFIEHIDVTKQPIVVGFSGGGDSNSLLQGLCNNTKIQNTQIKCVMLLGLPEWDNRLVDARHLCDSFGVELIEVSSTEVALNLGAKNQGDDWATLFERSFPNDDLEFVGTLAVKSTLRKIARKLNAQAIVTGLNAEDILAELLSYLTLGKKPRSFPVRDINGIDLWFPLYLTPKKIADGCYPKQARLNYEDRYPCHSYGRTMFYYAAQMIEDNSPGFIFDIIRGASQSIQANENSLSMETLVAELPPDVLAKWQSIFPAFRISLT